MNDTPRTDTAEVDNSNFDDWGSGPSGYVTADFARDLERELAEAKLALDEALSQRDEINHRFLEVRAGLRENAERLDAYIDKLRSAGSREAPEQRLHTESAIHNAGMQDPAPGAEETGGSDTPPAPPNTRNAQSSSQCPFCGYFGTVDGGSCSHCGKLAALPPDVNERSSK